MRLSQSDPADYGSQGPSFVPCDFVITWATYTVHLGHAKKSEASLLAVRLAVNFPESRDSWTGCVSPCEIEVLARYLSCSLISIANTSLSGSSGFR